MKTIMALWSKKVPDPYLRRTFSSRGTTLVASSYNCVPITKCESPYWCLRKRSKGD